ncbi:survival motor neuron protein 1-like isoform X1 [Haliotis rubra]|uniref:survival motor neuron protein 1-like isoform X1 n=1 Tax=Haliotis rubra TaxID=36100 RepID=UPI001EE57DFC|nr:survival motor neuron protein 1-like isoform X1 [Haliotis rubra]
MESVGNMAAAESGYVVFQRGKESDESDIWDDTALIKAYDNAASIMKARLAEREGGTNENGEMAGESVTQTQDGAAKKKKKKHRPKKKKQQQKWKIGDSCRAVFTEDGLLYDAEIIGIDEAESTCTVRYTEYQNEENQPLDRLLPPRPTSKAHTNVSLSETDSNDVTMQNAAPQRMGGRGKSSGAAPDHPTRASYESHPFFQGMPYPPFRFPSNHAAHAGGPRVPPMPPPPPPPPLMSEDVVSDDEALSSMLISWYMSGYHTGYYQGLQRGRQQQQGGGGAAR